MPDYFKRINTADLYQPFYQKLQQLVANCSALGVDYYAGSGFRSWDDQDKLYAQGRTTPGKIVTKAKGGQSNHNYGVAVDFIKDADLTTPGLQPTWKVEDYKLLADEAKKLGLEPGFYWNFQDPPHIQLNLGSVGLSFADLRQEYSNGGMPAVFQKLDQYSW